MLDTKTRPKSLKTDIPARPKRTDVALKEFATMFDAGMIVWEDDIPVCL